jgi:hypothetical protein
MRKTIKIGLVIGITIAFLTPMSLVIADDVPTVTVFSPNGGEVLTGEIAILWSASDDVTMDLNGSLLLEYSPDNGNNWSVIASGLNNTGLYLWNTTVVPDGDQYLIRVSATDESNNTGSDTSNSTFSIDNIDTVPPQVMVLYPNDGEVVNGEIAIQWSASDDVTMNLNGTLLVEYSPDNGINWSGIASGLNNTGLYLWNTTVVPDGNAYLVRVSATDESLNVGSDTSNSTFSIDNIDTVLPQVTVLYPNGGGEVLTGEIAILWSASDDMTMDLNGSLLLEYSPDNGNNWSVIASQLNNTGSYVWNTTVVPDGDQYLIRVSATDESNNTGSDTSNSTFSIDNIDTVPPQVMVLYPNGGEGVVGDLTILWSASDDMTMDLNGSILLEYSPDNGNNWSVIASQLNNTGSFVWNTTVVPDGNAYLIRVSATDGSNNTGSDTSNGTFSINNNLNYPPTIPQVIGPSAGGNGINFDFTANTTDPEADQIYYLFDWGNGNFSGWLGPVNSSVSVTTSYTWRDDGNYTIRVKAKDIYEGESDWSVVHPISIAPQINFSNVQLGHVYFKLFSFNRSFIFSDFLARLGVVIILTSHEMELKGNATDIVQSVTFKAENQMQIESMEIIDDNSSDGFSCFMNVSRGVYVLNITAYDGNGLLVDQYSLFTVFFIRVGRYATGLTSEGRLLRLRSIHPLRH